MIMTEAKTYIKNMAEIVHQELDVISKEWTSIPATLQKAMRYSLLAGGKRVRPVLTIATAEALGGSIKMALPFGCAIEMIHTYSLIHDDLPAMDDDDYRRGKLTNHKVFGEAMAILAGDGLLTEAFGLIAKGAREAHLPAAVSLDLIQEAVRYAGTQGMINGQVQDMESESKSITLDELEEIHRRKTGDLITYSIRVGALIAGANQETLEALMTFSYQLGLAFQIQDDILDVVGDQEIIGKPVGSDEHNKKATYPSLLGLDESRKRLQDCIHIARESILNREDLDPTRLLELADYLLLRDR
ncbi:polyprenyl synthetase family protein [Shimazuella sp. AN120528]|uniref:polyprenyl synthetase family protein n=1 Tax=Shimazuella soli TaxID=1892854 RepID=UPI001F0E4385|nr:farnesyl diphosphate synthase [Shimazuella soli]MCH5584203.1 polyprenyl synthetase family protein [Shimazuella soli]